MSEHSKITSDTCQEANVRQTTATAVTQKDIARRLSISRPLVAGVLSGNPRTGASELTKRLILETAVDMGCSFRLRPRACLQSRKTNTVVLAYVKHDGDQSRQNYASVVLGLAEELGSLGYKLELKRAPNNDSMIGALRNVLVQARAAKSLQLCFWGTDDEIEAQETFSGRLGNRLLPAADCMIKCIPIGVQADWDYHWDDTPNCKQAH